MTFRLNLDDISRILTSIQVAERHVQSGYQDQTDLLGNPLNNLVPLGLRTVSVASSPIFFRMLSMPLA